MIFKYLAGILFIFNIFVPLSGTADFNSRNENSGVKESVGIFEKVIDTLPSKSLKKGLKEYLKTINSGRYESYNSVGTSNTGMADFFKKRFDKNTCFQRAARDFYEDLKSTTKNSCPELGAERENEDECIKTKLTIDDYAGKQKKEYLQEGWLLKLAMKHTNHNLPAALELIAMCGHDDKNQGRFEYTKPNTGELEGMLFCPDAKADFFVPGSLSREANISPELVSKIKKLQGAEGTVLPPKHYHIYASAYLGCKMTQEGLSALEAKIVQTNVVRIYRGVRMCQASKSLLSQRDSLKKSVGFLEDSKKLSALAIQSWEERVSGKLDCVDLTSKAFEAQKCELLWALAIQDLSVDEKAVVLKKIANGLKRMDAAYLYNDWYLGGQKILGVQLPCTSFRLGGPAELANPMARPLSGIKKPTGWSDERYEAATKVLATWDVDFEWTVAQHAAGTQFGAQACQDYSKQKNPFEKPECTEASTLQDSSGASQGPPNKSSGIK